MTAVSSRETILPLPNRETTVDAPPIDVSVIVCTFNRADLLADAVVSLLQMQSPPGITYEILIVDNASTDATRSVSEGLAVGARVPVRYVYEKTPGVSAARNCGVRAARGHWIAFMDDDQIAAAGWLTELLAAAMRHQVRCIGGVNRLKVPENQQNRELAVPVRALLGDSLDDPTEVPYTRRHSPGAGNLLVERSLFDEIGLFDVTLAAAGEDVDLYRRMWGHGIRPWRAPLALTYHVVPGYRLSPEYLRWKCQRNGGHLAQRTARESGWLRLLIWTLVRAAHGLLVNVPRQLLAQVRGNKEAILGARCLTWKSLGCVRFGLHLLAPRCFPQRAFMKWMEFRSERDMEAQFTGG